MKFLDSLSFRTQILLGFCAVALIPLIIAICFITQVYSFTFQREVENEGNQQIVAISEKFDGFLQSSQEICESLCANNLTVNALIDKVNDVYQKELYTTLYRESSSIPVESLVSIYDAGGELRFTTKADGGEESLPLYWGILGKARSDREHLFHITDSIADGKSNILLQTCYTVINGFGAKLGYITMGLTRDDFNTLFSGCYNSGDVIFITDEHLDLIYSSNGNYGQSTMNELRLQNPSKNYWYTWQKDEATGYYIILQKPTTISESVNDRMFRISLLIAFFCLILCFMVSMILGRQLTEPINKLNKAMDLVKKGNLSIHVKTNQQNELGELTNNFNRMTEELDAHVKNMVQRQKDIKDMQIQLFQTQLNPHFLYNTLDSIKWAGRLHHLDDISSMAENLAYILQNSIRSEQFIPLKKELEIIDNYIQIQKIRFHGKFTYEVEIPEELTDCIVPKLMLQPIVENSIIHGLAEKEEGSISIYADQVGDNIHISVNDDGAGISKEIIEWLQTENFTENTGHLGLYNVNKIIKLYFGLEYGLKATVEDGIGTTVTIVLPIRKEKIDDNGIDR